MNTDTLTTLNAFSSSTSTSFYLYENNPFILLDRLSSSTILLQEQMESDGNDQERVSLYLTITCICLLIMVQITIFPTVLKVEKKNNEIFRLIMKMPVEAVKQLKHDSIKAKVCIQNKTFGAFRDDNIALTGTSVCAGKKTSSKHYIRNSAVGKFFLFFLLGVLYSTLLFVFGYILIDDEIHKSALLLKMSYSRSTQARLSLYIAREYVGNYASNFYTPPTLSTGLYAANELENIMVSIRQGNSSIGLPQDVLFDGSQNYIMNENACIDSTLASECASLFGGVVNSGLNPTVTKYTSELKSLQRITQQATSDQIRTSILTSTNWTNLETLESQFIQPAIAKSNLYYKEKLDASLNNSITEQIALFIVFFILSLVLFRWVYLP